MSILDNYFDNSSPVVQLSRQRQQIIDRYNQQQDREQLRREILQECARMIEERVNL